MRKNGNVIDIQFSFEAIMVVKKSQEQAEKKKKSRIASFLPFAIVVFTALAIGLVVILLRSKA